MIFCVVESGPNWIELLIEVAKGASIALVGVGAAAALVHNRIFRPQQMTYLREFLSKEYPNAELDGSRRGHPDITDLRQAREELDKYKKSNPSDFPQAVLNQHHIVNLVAYELSLALQHTGLMCLIGALPLKHVLVNAAGVIVEDWGRSKHLVEASRTQYAEREHLHRSPHRLCAEWIARLSALHLNKHYGWSPEELADLLDKKKYKELCKVLSTELWGIFRFFHRIPYYSYKPKIRASMLSQAKSENR